MIKDKSIKNFKKKQNSEKIPSKKSSIITDKDVLILRELLEDGRKSSSSISKQIDLGREIVNYRIKRLIKENLIIKFVPKINEKAINYQEYIILLKLNLEDEVSREKFIRENIGNKYLIWILKSNKGWDLIIRLYAQSVDEFKDKMAEILENFSEVLANYYTIINSEEIKQNEKQTLSKKLFDENLVTKDFEIIKKGEVVSLDSKDKQILNYLEDDARVQYKDIADKLEISSDTVKYRIDKMKEHGILEGITPIINFSKMGFSQYAAILKFKYLSKSEILEVCEYLKEDNEIVRAIKNLNSEEFFLNVICDNDELIVDFEKKIRNKFDKIDTLEIFKID
jgi:Lrp/AsnC family leucine-responsive transcriptional regulator